MITKKYFLILCVIIPQFMIAANQKHITIVIPSYNNANSCEKNLGSVFMQNYSNYHVIYIDDCSTDGMGNIIQSYIDNHHLSDKITFIRNSYNRKALANIFRAVHMCSNNDLIVVLDGDDALAHADVLSFINELFSTKNIWMAYAQYLNVPQELAIAQKIPLMGYARPTPIELIKSGQYRSSNTWCWSGLRMFYAGLFKKIKLEHLIYPNLEYKGKFFPTSYDGAIMYPMLEMCGAHFAHISDILLHRNIDTPLNDFKIHRDLQRLCGAIMKKFTPYPNLTNAPTKNESTNTIEIIMCTNAKQATSQLQKLPHISEVHILSLSASATSPGAFERIKQICNESQSQYILLTMDEQLSFSIPTALYWLNNTNALYIQCSKTLFNLKLPISNQPIEHIEDNIYVFCSQCCPSMEDAWCGLFKKEDLQKYLNNSSGIASLNNQILTNLNGVNHPVLCAI